jgi:putative ATP-binding cassette transporter
MNLIWFILRESWSIMTLAILMGASSGACSTLLLALINHAISHSVGGITSSLLWAYAGLAVVNLVTGFCSRVLLVRLSQTAVYKLRLRLSGWILACPLSHLEQLGANRLLATLTEDIQVIAIAVFNIPFICINLALVLGCLVYLCWLSWTVFLLVLAFLVAAVIAVQLLLNRASHSLKLSREQQDALFKHLRAITDGIKELKLHRERRDVFFDQELSATAAANRDYRTTGLTILSIATSFGEWLFFLILGLLVFGLPQISQPTGLLLSGYVLTITYLTRPLQGILEIIPNFTQAAVALQKVDTLGLSLASRAERMNSPRLQQRLPFQQLQLVGITHIYQREQEDNPFCLGPIDLSLHPSELVFIVGGNGSGKSTLAKLITGLYVPQSGEIYWNDTAVNSENREAYRQLFSAVFADFYLFERLLGIELHQLDQQAQDYLEKLQLDYKVRVQDGILSTIELSQGQRKRLALLTAYLEDRPIYLFDEWASDQDPYFREIFYRQIVPDLKQRGKTVLVISHDDRYFGLADRLIKLDYGQIVEQH